MESFGPNRIEEFAAALGIELDEEKAKALWDAGDEEYRRNNGNPHIKAPPMDVVGEFEQPPSRGRRWKTWRKR